MRKLLASSLYFSLFVQVLSIASGVFGLTLKVDPLDQILITAVGLETFVSLIQLSFYIWYSYHFKEVVEATFYRYHDWAITTPIMLFTTMLYFDYNNKPKEEEKTLQTFWNEHQKEILIVFAFNAVMLLFGYLYEIGILDLFTSNSMGFVGLIGSFYVMYSSFVAKNPYANLPLFIVMAVIWGLYGVAAIFPPIWKNVFYNLIDTVSKNFYGIFLTYVAYQRSI